MGVAEGCGLSMDGARQGGVDGRQGGRAGWMGTRHRCRCFQAHSRHGQFAILFTVRVVTVNKRVADCGMWAVSCVLGWVEGCTATGRAAVWAFRWAETIYENVLSG